MASIVSDFVSRFKPKPRPTVIEGSQRLAININEEYARGKVLRYPNVPRTLMQRYQLFCNVIVCGALYGVSCFINTISVV